MRNSIVGFTTGLLLAMTARAQLHTETVTYHQGETTLNGFLAYDEATAGRRPGVLVAPEWYGLNDYAKSRAKQLAALGYVAFGVDLYGDGAVADSPQQAGAWAGKLKSNRPLLRERIAAGLAALKQQPQCAPQHVAAIGYCFGGTAVLELARSGAEVAGVVSFHGGLDTPNPADAATIKAKVLVCHGADDPHVPPDQVAAFQDEMRKAKVDWQMNIYGGAVHSFTNPHSGNDPSKGVAYNARADHRSWAAMKIFFAEIFR